MNLKFENVTDLGQSIECLLKKHNILIQVCVRHYQTIKKFKVLHIEIKWN